MKIEHFSIRRVTILIFLMIALVAVVLSILAGGYFRQAAMNAQMNSLSRVIEVASQQMLKEIRQQGFELAMKLAHSQELVSAVQQGHESQQKASLDDPFINGFVGLSDLNLQKIRLYGLDLGFKVQSRLGMQGLEPTLPTHLANQIIRRSGVNRLKAVDALWMSSKGPMLSIIVPLGGLRQVGYLELVIDPSMNLPQIASITRTPISIYDRHNQPLVVDRYAQSGQHYLPIEYRLTTSDGQLAFRIVGYEDVTGLEAAMGQTQTVTISGFLVLSLMTLLLALWLFNRFLFVPMKQLISEMRKVTDGQLDLQVNRTGLQEFSQLAEAFNSMTEQVRIRTGDLEHLLDMDESSILCFSPEKQAIYLNRRALELFGYAAEDIGDMEWPDFFIEDIDTHCKLRAGYNQKHHCRITARLSQGEEVACEAVVSKIQNRGGAGYAIALSVVDESQPSLPDNLVNTIEQSEQRMQAIEQSLGSLLEMAQQDPGVVMGLSQSTDVLTDPQGDADRQKICLRETAVSVMQDALAYWEQQGQSKLSLAERSGIWPVYIDKSTPTTRTLDKYLSLESCPRNPRCQRVVDTAEFVLRELDSSTDYRQQLKQSLQSLRGCMAGK